MKKTIKQRIKDLQEIAEKRDGRDVAFSHFEEALSVIEAQQECLDKAMQIVKESIDFAKIIEKNN